MTKISSTEKDIPIISCDECNATLKLKTEEEKSRGSWWHNCATGIFYGFLDDALNRKEVKEND